MRNVCRCTHTHAKHFLALIFSRKKSDETLMYETVSVCCVRMMHHLLTKNLMDFWCFSFSLASPIHEEKKNTLPLFHCYCCCCCCCLLHLTTHRTYPHIFIHPNIIVHMKQCFAIITSQLFVAAQRFMKSDWKYCRNDLKFGWASERSEKKNFYENGKVIFEHWTNVARSGTTTRTKSFFDFFLLLLFYTCTFRVDGVFASYILCYWHIWHKRIPTGDAKSHENVLEKHLIAHKCLISSVEKKRWRI